MALEKFHFATSDGTKIVVPFLNDKLSYKQAKKIRAEHKDDDEALGEAFMAAALSDKEFEIVDNLSLRDYSKFLKGWTEAGDAGVGE
ncbi:hypothetical protein [Corynebacterium pyruviciproducens]